MFSTDQFRVQPRAVAEVAGGHAVLAQPIPVSEDKRAACAGDTEWISVNFPTEEMHDTCRSCPVLDTCYEWALAHEEHGFWAGTNPRDRKRIREERGQVAFQPHYGHLFGLGINRVSLSGWQSDPERYAASELKRHNDSVKAASVERHPRSLDGLVHPWDAA